MRSLVVVRGGGDLASGVIYRLNKAGYRVLILEQEYPTAIRRKVSFCEAVYEGEAWVEDVCCRRIRGTEEAEQVWEQRKIPLLVDEQAEVIEKIRPQVLVDAILAKKNLGTRMDMASLTIALGPGFEAGRDVHYVVETMRGHDLGRILSSGTAMPNTGVPGVIAGVASERVIHAPCDGVLHLETSIGDLVQKGQTLARIGETEVPASIGGVLRGILRDGCQVKKGWKMADIDPRCEEQKNCFTISDKARCLSGSVLEILLREGCL